MTHRTLKLLVCNWPHSVKQNHFFIKMFFYQGFRYSEVSPEDYVQFASQKFRFPARRPNDVSSRPDTQLSNASAVQTMCHPVRTPSCPMHQPFERRVKPFGRPSD